MAYKLYLLLVLIFAFSVNGCNTYDNNTISYNNDIRPILSDKCFKCHGPDANQRKSNFRLDTEAGAYAAMKTNPHMKGIVPGHPELSEVVLRIKSKDHDYIMPTPQSNLNLNQKEIELIESWIKQGAKYEKHWAFNPIIKPKLPELKDDWVKNEIDLFILDRQRAQGLKPSESESKEKLLKRVYHDIIGLPPTIEQQDAFLNTKDGDKAYDKIVDQLLVNKGYGEKMAILWMDLARYADSHGYQDDGLRTMWPWRDWVIHAFNQNYSYKKFITYQLAGDMLPNANKETILATGFNRNHKITQEGGVIDEEYRIEYVSDRTNTFSKGLLAMTFECAKCHDHKYDPISQKDYYGTFAFFNQLNEKGFYGDILVASLADPPFLKITSEDKKSILNFINMQDTSALKVMIMKDSGEMRKTYLLNRGQYDQPREVAAYQTPTEILKFDTTKYAKNRLGLTNWMFDEKNPLPARVFVNLLWQEFFGRGIVKTSGDFGLQGDLPTHPELLDWLAFDFVEHNWDIKRLVKQIVTSATYRQSSNISKEHLAKDPENKYIAHGPRLRLTSELLRDHILASSKLLHTEIGGPSVKPYQPKGLWEVASSGRGQLVNYKTDKGSKLYRRGLYNFIKRTVPPPAMLTFDASNRDQCEVKRLNTNTPLQALVLMNDVQVLEASRFFAQQLAVSKSNLNQKIETIFRAIVCRKPNEKEVKSLTKYYSETKQNLDEKKAIKLIKIGDSAVNNSDVKETAALMQTIQLIYNLEESSIR